MKKKKIILIVSLVGILMTYFYLNQRYGLSDYLTLDYLKQSQNALISQYHNKPAVFVSVFMSIYILVTALSIPGAAIMTLAGGAILGTLVGTLAVSFASTIGATLAFLVARTLLRDWIQKKYGQRLRVINEGIKNEGAFYLFSLRLVPAFPFFLINILMGLTPITTWTYYWVSQLGMLAGTVVYVFAGTQLGAIESLSDVVSAPLLAAFVALGLFPLIAKKTLNYLKSKRPSLEENPHG